MNNDLIKRNIAIAYATSGLIRRIDGEEWIRISEVKQSLQDVPTVEERPQGEWIEKVETKQLGHGWLTAHEIVCSFCGGSGENDENIPQCWKFCPNCGADMRGEEP